MVNQPRPINVPEKLDIGVLAVQGFHTNQDSTNKTPKANTHRNSILIASTNDRGEKNQSSIIVEHLANEDPSLFSKASETETSITEKKPIEYISVPRASVDELSTLEMTVSSSNELQGNEVDLESQSNPNIKGSLFSFSRFPRDLIIVLPSVIATCGAGAIQPAQTILVGMIFSSLAAFAKGEYATPAQFMNDILIYTMSMVGISGLLIFLNWVMVAGWDYHSALQVKRAQKKVFHCFLGRDFEWYDNNKGIMGTLTILIRSFEEFRLATSLNFALNLKSMACIICALIVSFIYSWSLTLICISSLPIIMLLIAVTNKPTNDSLVEYKSAVEEASSLIEWSLASIQTVKQFNSQHSQVKALSSILDGAFIHYKKFINYIGFQQGLCRFVMLAMFIPTFVYGGKLVKNGTINSGDVLTVFWSGLMLANSLSELSMRMESIHRGTVASLRIKNFLDLGISHATYFKKMIGLFPDKCQGSISFKNVCVFVFFAY